MVVVVGDSDQEVRSDLYLLFPWISHAGLRVEMEDGGWRLIGSGARPLNLT